MGNGCPGCGWRRSPLALQRERCNESKRSPARYRIVHSAVDQLAGEVFFLTARVQGGHHERALTESMEKHIHAVDQIIYLARTFWRSRVHAFQSLEHHGRGSCFCEVLKTPAPSLSCFVQPLFLSVPVRSAPPLNVDYCQATVSSLQYYCSSEHKAMLL